jgi:ATP-dependent DNA helicase 2 subunit 2
MGEVRFVWPDLTSPKAQIQFSSLVEGMALRDMVAVVRWVQKDQADPVIGVCVPEMEYPGEERRLDYMFWVKVCPSQNSRLMLNSSCRSLKTNTTFGSLR